MKDAIHCENWHLTYSLRSRESKNVCTPIAILIGMIAETCLRRRDVPPGAMDLDKCWSQLRMDHKTETTARKQRSHFLHVAITVQRNGLCAVRVSSPARRLLALTEQAARGSSSSSRAAFASAFLQHVSLERPGSFWAQSP